MQILLVQGFQLRLPGCNAQAFAASKQIVQDFGAICLEAQRDILTRLIKGIRIFMACRRYVYIHIYLSPPDPSSRAGWVHAQHRGYVRMLKGSRCSVGLMVGILAFDVCFRSVGRS